MKLRTVCALAFLGSAFWSACAHDDTDVTTLGPVGEALSQAAEHAHVPRDLLIAIAIEEGGLRLAPHRVFASDDHVPVAGHLELRHGAFDSLHRASELSGVAELTLIEDTALATRVGAEVLAELGTNENVGSAEDLSSWAPALRKLSGFTDGLAQEAYANRVLSLLARGGRFPAYAGEVVFLPAHPEVQTSSVSRQALSPTPDFPGAMWTTTSCTNKCNVGRTAGLAVDTIVIHDTEGGWNASVATLQNDPGKSAHYLIDVDGSRVTQFRPETDITWHSGNQNYNGRSIAIEHVGYIDDPNGFADGLYETSAKLVENIRTRYTIPLDRAHIIGHYQVPDGSQIAMASPACAEPLMSCINNNKYGGASHHTDPGPQWQWCQYMQRLGGSCTCNDTNAHLTCTTDKTQAVRCENGQVQIHSCANGCAVQGTGVDDVCVETITPVQSRVPTTFVRQRAVRPPTDLMTGKGDTPAVVTSQEGGCDMSRGGGRPSTALAFVLLVLLLSAFALRRRFA